MYVERECTDWISGMTHSILRNFCDACIHLCDTMVHVCIHIHVKMHLWSDACVWQDSFMYVTMNHAHVWDDPDTRIEYNSDIYSSMHIHFCCLIMLNSYPCMFVHYTVHIPIYFFKEREPTPSEFCAYMHTHVDLERDRVCDM